MVQCLSIFHSKKGPAAQRPDVRAWFNFAPLSLLKKGPAAQRPDFRAWFNVGLFSLLKRGPAAQRHDFRTWFNFGPFSFLKRGHAATSGPLSLKIERPEKREYRAARKL